jgi:hypothetical protein
MNLNNAKYHGSEGFSAFSFITKKLNACINIYMLLAYDMGTEDRKSKGFLPT